jgi:hypothetical protein
MFNVRDHQLRAIKHIENEFLSGLNVITSRRLSSNTLVKVCWIFYFLNDSINALAPNFWKNNVKCYELTLVM